MIKKNTVAALILAGGSSSRMGCAKLLLEYEGEPLVMRAARTACAAGLDPVVVITGAYDKEIREALAGLLVEFVHNESWAQGQSTSIKAGVVYLRQKDRLEALVIMVADQPYVSVRSLEGLISCFNASADSNLDSAFCDTFGSGNYNRPPASVPIVVTAAGSRIGNPALFPIEYLDELECLQGDKGARALFTKFPIWRYASPDDQVFLDIDTPADYHALTG